MARKKTLSVPLADRRRWIQADSAYSIRRQCRLAAVPRSRFYYEPVPETAENLALLRVIDEVYLRHPEYGYRRMTDALVDIGHEVNRKRVLRLMRTMGLQAITPGPHTSKPAPAHPVYPYLLRNVEIARVNHVWSADITYIPMSRGFLYLTAVIDWFSRFVLSWELSNTLEGSFCVAALEAALRRGKPEIFNTDQGSQFTADAFTGVLLKQGIAISMDGRGRALDNAFIERLWWTVKYEDVYPRVYEDGPALYRGLERFFRYYNEERRHSSLGKRTPAEVFAAGGVF
jgi:putative transposase